MSKLINLFCNKDIEKIVKEKDDYVPLNVFEDRISEIENNVEVDDLDSAELFFQEFGIAFLGSVIV